MQVDDFFERAELEPVRDATRDSVDQLAQRLYNAGKTTSSSVTHSVEAVEQIVLFVAEVKHN